MDLAVNVCRYLRWKGYHGATRTSRSALSVHPSLVRSHCTCLRTGQAWGPDGGPATAGRCVEVRSCYSPDAAPAHRGRPLATIHRLLRRWLS